MVTTSIGPDQGLQINNGYYNTISFDSLLANDTNNSGLYVANSSHNVITSIVASDPNGYGINLDVGANLNTISNSSVVQGCSQRFPTSRPLHRGAVPTQSPQSFMIAGSAHREQR